MKTKGLSPDLMTYPARELVRASLCPYGLETTRRLRQWGIGVEVSLTVYSDCAVGLVYYSDQSGLNQLWVWIGVDQEAALEAIETQIYLRNHFIRRVNLSRVNEPRWRGNGKTTAPRLIVSRFRDCEQALTFWLPGQAPFIVRAVEPGRALPLLQAQGRLRRIELPARIEVCNLPGEAALNAAPLSEDAQDYPICETRTRLGAGRRARGPRARGPRAVLASARGAGPGRAVGLTQEAGDAR